MRTLTLLALLAAASMAAKTSTSATVACPEANQPVSSKDKSVMALGCGQINGFTDNPGSVYIPGGVPTEEKNLVLERSFVQAIQGNLDRETVEYRNAERD
ncbi:MAG: hypothetical protein RL318_1635 [Fibrobacterota bacterium]